VSEPETRLDGPRPADAPVELSPPDISAYRDGNTGVAFAHRFDSGVAGPQAMIVGIVHGNELCGAIVLDRLLRDGVRPRRGSLTLVFANPRAYAAFDPAEPAASRYVDEDLNRIWSPLVLDGGRTSAELDRARELRPLIDEADVLLDLHSMQHDCSALILSGPSRKGRTFAMALGLPPLIVIDEGHASGRRLRDYGGFSRPDDARNALLVECGQHWRRTTADLANRVTDRFLRLVGTVGPDGADDPPAEADRRPACIRVTRAIRVRTDTARFLDRYTGLEVIPAAGTPILVDGDATVRTPYDDCVLVMPAKRLNRGQTAVRLGRYIDCASGDGG
jgi:predicted deacylase